VTLATQSNGNLKEQFLLYLVELVGFQTILSYFSNTL